MAYQWADRDRPAAAGRYDRIARFNPVLDRSSRRECHRPRLVVPRPGQLQFAFTGAIAKAGGETA
jgi:hypothetical protein